MKSTFSLYEHDNIQVEDAGIKFEHEQGKTQQIQGLIYGF